jgi:UDP-2,4-diacetamido-2,4,6-trideoxy-beta-L-altropyranose hydrolase
MMGCGFTEMKVVLRADASVSIGTGHVIRCLTLADALKILGADVSFVSRAHEGNINDVIADHGFEVVRLPAPLRGFHAADSRGYATSLGALWQEDVEQMRAAVDRTGMKPDWLVVDHYGVDRNWELALAGTAQRLMVLDDMADRVHDCDLLLDQNFDNPLHARYAQLLPARARQLLGTRYALVRPEFKRYRAAALARRNGQVSRLLVSMGGTDPRNDTEKAVAGIAMSKSRTLAVDVIVGSSNPHLQGIRKACQRAARVTLHVQTARMAELMMNADFAVCAGGSTTWERCVLGLPALVAVQSSDQLAIAKTLEQKGAHRFLGLAADLGAQDYAEAIDSLLAKDVARMSVTCAELCDGEGAGRVAAQLLRRE